MPTYAKDLQLTKLSDELDYSVLMERRPYAFMAFKVSKFHLWEDYLDALALLRDQYIKAYLLVRSMRKLPLP